ncbi:MULTISPECIES: alpha/beta fold hydrolase [unclassified Streptomyces]|uniref:alpha/beta fold hydrolase n=1 Tax=unclassified Streptomyces TaxID=2593676 RepID=UPI00225B8521|nr:MULTISPECIES: alpha/beta fold hydrolase [unclassified Streptomyces]MCX5141169.1 alpha/beta fold hydrolase [Streptomyces sp. NBC_00338]WRZ65688.1 alpha/beta fold hydrolase [Streptomyces sp. NBC_01257]WSU59683.1 alpha/beta fold hydrolase [Streptomyces sp. NBC_01104]
MTGQGNDADFAALLPLRTGGTEPPLFCIHPGFALCWAYGPLMRGLGRDQPLYGIQARGIIGDEPLPETFDELVDDYLGLVRSIRPHGPYRLLGWSFGGLAAHAMATRLQQAGEEVELLAMMDTTLVADPAILSTPAHARQLEKEFASVRDIVPDSDRLLRIVINLNRLRGVFDPDRFTGDLVMFTADQEPARDVPVAEAWGPYVTGSVVEHRIDCSHLTMMSARPARAIAGLLATAVRDRV